MTPTTSSPVYAGPILVNASETIEAFATLSGFAPSTVATARYIINPAPDFQVSVNPTTLTIVAGQSGTATFTVTPENGFNSQVSFTCSGLPAEAGCRFNPPMLTPDGAAVSTTLTVTTTAPSVVMRLPVPTIGRPADGLLLSAFAAVLVVGLRRSRARYRWQVASLLLVVVLAASLTSCGGGGGGGTMIGKGNPGTPIGTGTVGVSASTSGANPTNHGAVLIVTVTP